MTRARQSIFVAIAVMLAMTAGRLRASDMVGVYCLIDKVVLEPADANPSAIQVWGAFSFAVPRDRSGMQPHPAGSFGSPGETGDVYGQVQTGYMYFTCASGREVTCRNEWADLKKAAGRKGVIGFGSRYGTNGTVRAATVKPADADVYPINFGLVPIGTYVSAPGAAPQVNRTQYPDLIAALEAAIARK
jgi:hypothetical protein